MIDDRMQWINIFMVLNKNAHQLEILYPIKPLFNKNNYFWK